MQTFHTISDLRKALGKERSSGRSIGFVPTMGALHQGHLDLMKRSLKENDVLVVSIYVNPIQFNNKEDLEKYPRVLQTDSQLLENIGCHYLFAPTDNEMYPEPATANYDFGLLSEVMEGAFRPGHFNGVAIVVRKLFEIVEPTASYFGEKDFQQLAIIKQLVKLLNLAVRIIPCVTVRENDGLAMSSRNQRLTAEERAIAPKIHEIMQQAVKLRNVHSPEEMRNWAITQIEKTNEFSLDYLEIADDQLLQPLKHWNDAPGARIFIAVFLGKVRLIDNVKIF